MGRDTCWLQLFLLWRSNLLNLGEDRGLQALSRKLWQDQGRQETPQAQARQKTEGGRGLETWPSRRLRHSLGPHSHQLQRSCLQAEQEHPRVTAIITALPTGQLMKVMLVSQLVCPAFFTTHGQQAKLLKTTGKGGLSSPLEFQLNPMSTLLLQKWT